MAKLILIANPGSSSRKYALYDGDDLLLSLHFEYQGKNIICNVEKPDNSQIIQCGIANIAFAAKSLQPIIEQSTNHLIKDIKNIGLRIVAPDSFFTKDRLMDGAAIKRLESLESKASIHIHACLQEIILLRKTFPSAQIIGISDSAAHSGKPEHASIYAIPKAHTDTFDIKRFGYHGISIQSIIDRFSKSKLPHRLVICHLGSGSSVTAVNRGVCVDTTMGYSPLEGVTMATRSGSIDYIAAESLRSSLKLEPEAFERLLNEQSGLLGISGVSTDIRELLKVESSNDQAKLALKHYVYSVQKAIGAMTAALGGVDALIFTGTVGQRSYVMRSRIVKDLHYLGLSLDPHANQKQCSNNKTLDISKSRYPGSVLVVPTNEAEIIHTRTKHFKPEKPSS